MSYFNMLEYDSEVDTIISSRITLDVYGMSNDGAELGSGPIALQEHFREGVDWNENIIGFSREWCGGSKWRGFYKGN